MTAAMVDGLARKHFPPCMRHLWEEGNAKHHLKHFARLQFGLFLKVRRPALPLPPLSRRFAVAPSAPVPNLTAAPLPSSHTGHRPLDR